MKALTLSQAIQDHLTEKGLSVDGAKVVLARLEEQHKDMPVQWELSAIGVPSSMIAILCYQADRLALQWIDHNCPDEPCRKCFVKENKPMTQAQIDEQNAWLEQRERETQDEIKRVQAYNAEQEHLAGLQPLGENVDYRVELLKRVIARRKNLPNRWFDLSSKEY